MFPTAWLKALIPAAAWPPPPSSRPRPPAPPTSASITSTGRGRSRPTASAADPERFEELPPAHGRVIERRTEIENCRVVVRRRVNEYGEEVLRRVRICDEDEPARERRPRLALPRDVEDDFGGGPDLVPPGDIPYEEGVLR